MAESQSKDSMADISMTVDRRMFNFLEAKGKTLEGVEFSSDSDYHCITLSFEDKTRLNLAIKAGFTLKADYSDWQTGDQRVLNRWELMRNS